MTRQSCSAFSLFLKHDDAIGLQVTHVNLHPLFDDIRMRREEEPTNMREEKSTLGVVGIRVGLGVLVVDSMIMSPSVGVALQKVSQNVSLAIDLPPQTAGLNFPHALALQMWLSIFCLIANVSYNYSRKAKNKQKPEELGIH